MEDKKAAIFRSGKELFIAQGFKNTNVSGITKRAGVSVGTFYNYYPSKEKLFMAIFLEENVKLKQSMMASADLNDDPLTMIKAFMAMNISGMKANPILREWYNRDVFDKIEKQYREDRGNDAVDFLYGSSLELVKKWQAEGKMRSDINYELIMAIFAALINIDTHKEEIGLQYFPQLLDYMTEFIIKGLTDSSK